MVAIMREADREPVSAVAKRHGISELTIYTWRKRFGSWQANDVRRLRQLEAENARRSAVNVVAGGTVKNLMQVPKPSPIENVFAMSEPQHMLSKLLWEIDALMQSQSVWVDNETFPTPIFRAWNAAVTAWHITDWLWASKSSTRATMATVHGFVYEETATGLRRGLEKFQEAVAMRERSLYVCREIANGSKHMRRTKSDPDIKAKAIWREAISRVGLVVPGDLVLSLEITDGQTAKDAVRWFIEAFAYWEILFNQSNWISAEMRLPDKILKLGRLKTSGVDGSNGS